MRVSQGDIVLLPFPFSNLGEMKVRPALVVSSDEFNRGSGDCLMVPLTSVIKDGDYSVIIEQADLSSGKLLKNSRIRVDKIFCVEKGLVSMKIGKLGGEVFGRVRDEIVGMF